jgi:hypothetical protein
VTRDTAILGGGQRILLLGLHGYLPDDGLWMLLVAAVQGIGDSGGKILGVLMQIANLAVDPRHAGAVEVLVGCLCRDLAKSLGLVRSDVSVRVRLRTQVVLCRRRLTILEIYRVWTERSKGSATRGQVPWQRPGSRKFALGLQNETRDIPARIICGLVMANWKYSGRIFPMRMFLLF